MATEYAAQQVHVRANDDGSREIVVLITVPLSLTQSEVQLWAAPATQVEPLSMDP